jgi:hypothetical protein
VPAVLDHHEDFGIVAGKSDVAAVGWSTLSTLAAAAITNVAAGLP